MKTRFYSFQNMHPRVGSHPIIKVLLFSLLCLGFIVFPGVVSAQVVDIPDPGLRAAIAQALDKAPGDAITRAEMETLVELQASFRDIADLRGIEYAINLTELNLWGNRISDISPLGSLINLTYLDLDDNSLSDISPLASLTNLTVLWLSFNSLSDISPLASLTNLTRLYLDDNSLSDISPLANLTNLTVLSLGGNNISGTVPLIALTNLERLYLNHNTISDVSPLASLRNLEGLYLNNNSLSNIFPLASLTTLRVLDLDDNNISDVSPLASLTPLRVLYLNNNSLSDISPLASLRNLTLLNLSRNSLSDIFPLASLTTLERLYLQNNNISDIETIERLMAQGTVVYFRGNPAFQTPGPKIEDGWVWLILPATDVSSGSQAARSGRDFLSEASGGAVTEAHVAVNGARAGTRVGDNVWTAARLDATDPNNLNAIAEDFDPDVASLMAPGGVAIHAETRQEIGDTGWTSEGLDVTDRDKRDALLPDAILETHINYPVAYGVVPIHAETPQKTRVYIGAGPVKVWFNGTLVYRDTDHWSGSDYETAVPVTLNAGNNVLFIAAYRPYPWSSRWGAFFGFQDGTGGSVDPPGAGDLDVNGDGQITVVDLAIVALFYGTRVPVGMRLAADVNSDGVVDLSDLIAVAAGIDAAGNGGNLSADTVQGVLAAVAEQVDAMEAVPEAPARLSISPHARRAGVAYQNVAAALEATQHLAIADARLRKWMPLLKELLQQLRKMREIPDTTALLPNYPNPFNPETWIPYHLATDAAVVLTIYDVWGNVVRELRLGHQPAGVYESRGRAAYWDGRNSVGEPVASGLYFYTLTAGDFTATRKLLIRK